MRQDNSQEANDREQEPLDQLNGEVSMLNHRLTELKARCENQGWHLVDYHGLDGSIWFEIETYGFVLDR